MLKAASPSSTSPVDPLCLVNVYKINSSLPKHVRTQYLERKMQCDGSERCNIWTHMRHRTGAEWTLAAVGLTSHAVAQVGPKGWCDLGASAQQLAPSRDDSRASRPRDREDINPRRPQVVFRGYSLSHFRSWSLLFAVRRFQMKSSKNFYVNFMSRTCFYAFILQLL